MEEEKIEKRRKTRCLTKINQKMNNKFGADEKKKGEEKEIRYLDKKIEEKVSNNCKCIYWNTNK